MTTAEMVARVRTFLDESTADFYSDTEIYRALNEAQVEMYNVIAGNYHQQNNVMGKYMPVPTAIEPLVTFYSFAMTLGTSQIISYTAPFVYPVKLQIDLSHNSMVTPITCKWVDNLDDARAIVNNATLSKATIWWKERSSPAGAYVIHFNPPVSGANGLAFMDYITPIPNTISVSGQPSLDEVAHDAMCERASWILVKDREMGVAQTHLQIYQSLMQELMK